MTQPTKREFSSIVCRPYCVFFKEGQKEDMACGAALVAVKLARRGLVSTGDLPGPPDAQSPVRDYPILRDLVCERCPFVLDGCDFRLPERPEDAVPCGGFVLLGLLLEAGMIDSESLRTYNDE
jgi:hypothetical protein